MSFYLDPKSRQYSVERRSTITAVPQDKRVNSVATTQVQYEFLRDCLIRREEHRRLLGAKERRARHILVSVIAAFVLLLFGTTDSALTISVFGTTMTVTLIQLIAIAPFFMTYLIVYAGTRAAREYRIEQEAWALDLELRRFGCPTSYSVVGPIRRFAAAKDEHGKSHKFTRWSRRLFLAHDAFLGIGVALTYVIAGTQAAKVYSGKANTSPLAVIGLVAYLVLAFGTGLFTIVASWKMRQQRGTVFQDFLAWKVRNAAAHDDSKKQGEPTAHPENLVGVIHGQEQKPTGDQRRNVDDQEKVRIAEAHNEN